MKSLLCCLAAYLMGSCLLEIESIWAGVLGGLLLPVIMLWPMWLIINWLIPPFEEAKE